jgi:hypothetical protein
MKEPSLPRLDFGFANSTNQGLFDLGAIVGTPRAIDAMRRAGVSGRDLLLRHIAGDWGEVHPDDKGLNEEALRENRRIMSVYPLAMGETIWIITESDRSVTTLLLPEDY